MSRIKQEGSIAPRFRRVLNVQNIPFLPFFSPVLFSRPQVWRRPPRRTPRSVWFLQCARPAACVPTASSTVVTKGWRPSPTTSLRPSPSCEYGFFFDLSFITLHYKAKMQFLDCRRKEQLLITLLNRVNFNVLVLDQEPFSKVAITYKDHRYATRARLKDLHLPKPNANFLKRTMAYQAMTLWNKMPEVIRNADSKKTPKTLYENTVERIFFYLTSQNTSRSVVMTSQPRGCISNSTSSGLH